MGQAGSHDELGEKQGEWDRAGGASEAIPTTSQSHVQPPVSVNPPPNDRDRAASSTLRASPQPPAPTPPLPPSHTQPGGISAVSKVTTTPKPPSLPAPPPVAVPPRVAPPVLTDSDATLAHLSSLIAQTESAANAAATAFQHDLTVLRQQLESAVASSRLPRGDAEVDPAAAPVEQLSAEQQHERRVQQLLKQFAQPMPAPNSAAMMMPTPIYLMQPPNRPTPKRSQSKKKTRRAAAASAKNKPPSKAGPAKDSDATKAPKRSRAKRAEPAPAAPSLTPAVLPDLTTTATPPEVQLPSSPSTTPTSEDIIGVSESVAGPPSQHHHTDEMFSPPPGAIFTPEYAYRDWTSPKTQQQQQQLQSAHEATALPLPPDSDVASSLWPPLDDHHLQGELAWSHPTGDLALSPPRAQATLHDDTPLSPETLLTNTHTPFYASAAVYRSRDDSDDASDASDSDSDALELSRPTNAADVIQAFLQPHAINERSKQYLSFYINAGIPEQLKSGFLSGRFTELAVRQRLAFMMMSLEPDEHTSLIARFETMCLQSTFAAVAIDEPVRPLPCFLHGFAALASHRLDAGLSPLEAAPDDIDGIARMRLTYFFPTADTNDHKRKQSHSDDAASPDVPSIDDPLPSPNLAVPSHFLVQINGSAERLSGYAQSQIVDLLRGANSNMCALWDLMLRLDFRGPANRISFRWSMNGQTEGHLFQVRVRADGSEFYCLAHQRSVLKGGSYLNVVESVMPFPADAAHPLPPYVPGVDQDEEVLLNGYRPPVSSAELS